MRLQMDFEISRRLFETLLGGFDQRFQFSKCWVAVNTEFFLLLLKSVQFVRCDITCFFKVTSHGARKAHSFAPLN